MKIVTVDWRSYGDYSAVGQLTKKIFSCGPDLAVHSIQIDENNAAATIRDECNPSTGAIVIALDNVESLDECVAKITPDYIYVRLSPNLAVLEFAARLARRNEYRLITHYMDAPASFDLTPSDVLNLERLYRHVISSSSYTCVIHESVVEEFHQRYGVVPEVVGNFFDDAPRLRRYLCSSATGVVTIRYFGGIDYKMNASALYEFCSVIGKIPWASFEIYSNSGINKEMRGILNEFNNIKVLPSNLDEAAYQMALSGADVLMLAYNWDAKSVDYLKHSFSNKILDYISTGVPIIAVGPMGIPSIDLFICLDLGLVASSRSDIEGLMSDKACFIHQLNTKTQESYDRLIDFARSRKANLDKFLSKLENGLSESVGAVSERYATTQRKEDSNFRKCLDYFNRRRSAFVVSNNSRVK